MPGISFLDNNTSYSFAVVLSWIIKAGPALFGVLSAGIIFADWKDWKPKKRGLIILKWLIHIIVFSLLIFCIFYGIDGRYTETDVGDHGNTSYYYFGKAKNGVRFGFGKVFDNEKHIYMISNAVGNKTYQNARMYGFADGKPYVLYEGTVIDGKREREGKSYDWINGEQKLIYEGGYKNGLHDGSGTETTYYNSGAVASRYIGGYLNGEKNGYGVFDEYEADGTPTFHYEGGWAYGKASGYGVELKYKDGKVNHAYRGTQWDGKYWGSGVLEYYDENGLSTLWHGYCYDDEQTDDGVFYDKDGTFWASEDNGSLKKDDNGESVRDEDRIKELMEKWPLPDERIINP